MIFIADNEVDQLATLQYLLRKLFPEEEIWPADERPFTNWDDVTKELTRKTENNDRDLLVILDLGLEAQHMASAAAGVQRARLLRKVREHAVFMAYTQFGDTVRSDRNYHEIFDGLIDSNRPVIPVVAGMLW